jgi:large subunit ribosomal protein L25
LHTVDHVKVRALPENLPESLDFSIESLMDFEMAIHLRDLPLPDGITLLSDPDEVVAKVVAPHAPEAEPEVVAAEVPEETPEAGAEAKTEE